MPPFWGNRTRLIEALLSFFTQHSKIMGKKIQRLTRFLKVDIWRITPTEASPVRYFFISIAKKVMLAVEFFINKGVMATASALTYSSLLAIVPIVAVLFAIARGFGFSKYIEEWFLDALSSQPQAADVIVGFVNSYLVHTHRGIFLGIGLLFMLWTVLMLIHNIEQAFNDIWQVKQQRSILRTVTDYLSMFFLAPIVIVIQSGLSIFMATIAEQMDSFMLLGPMVRILLESMPYVLTSATFIVLYIFMPNTKVHFKSVIVPGILAGIAMQGLQFIYINSQIFLSSYNAIYGSFAALPLFMLWVQLSWTICLFGAELSYTNQNLEEFAFLAKTEDLSHRNRLLLSIILLSRICKRFSEGKRPYTALQLKLETSIPIRITNDLLYDMVQINLLTESSASGKDEEPVFQPAMSLEKITVGTVVDRLEATGHWVLDIDLHQLMGSSRWSDVIQQRKLYLHSLRDVPVVAL